MTTGTSSMTPPELEVGLVGPAPPPNGGMAMQTAQLARLLRSEGIRVHLVTTNSPCRPALMDRVPVVRALLRLPPFLHALWRMAGRVDVIHLMANSGWSWQLLAAPALWVGWLRATPVIVNYRGGNAGDYFRRSWRWVRPSLSRAAAVVVPSGFLQAVFRAYGQAPGVIPNIIDRELFQPAPWERRPVGTAFTFVITRNLEPIYGVDTAIRALAQARAQDPALRLRIAGSGPQEAELKALTRTLGIADAVTFEGRLERKAIAALYGAADAMINPATVDNMPNSVLEALACGVPVISSNAGGVAYIVSDGETALLFPPGDAHALCRAMLRLKRDSELRARLIANGLARVEDYTWPRVRDQWLDLYRTLAHRTGRLAA